MKLKPVMAGLLFLAVLTVLPAQKAGEKREPGVYARIQTNQGSMLFKLDYENTPLTVANFATLALGNMVESDRQGPYYDGLEFYRNVKNYAVFSGDSNNNGTGSPGYTFPRESGGIYSAENFGTLMMDGLLDQSHGSRFFFVKNSDVYLDAKYTPFGGLIEGVAVLKRLKSGDTITSVTIEQIGSEAEALNFTQEYFISLKDQRNREMEDQLKDSDPQLYSEVQKLGESYSQTLTGIYYSITQEGSGGTPVYGQMVRVHYSGQLPDGTEFDNSRRRGQSFDFVLGKQQVIPGWTEILLDMKAGERRMVIIPPQLAYGQMSVGPIPPGSWLVFDIELLSIK